MHGKPHACEAVEHGVIVASQPARASLQGGRKGPASNGELAAGDKKVCGWAVANGVDVGLSGAGSMPGVSAGRSLWACDGRSSRW